MNALVDIAWLAGILEGEGTFLFGTSPKIGIQMVDRDVLVRVANIMERYIDKRPKIAEINRVGINNRQSVYNIQIYSQSALIIMQLIVHHMGDRRRKKIWQILNGYKGKPIEDVRGLFKRLTLEAAE